MSHTKLPWASRQSGVALVVFNKDTTERVGVFYNTDNAALIVKAANAHDELVEALKAIADGEGHADEIARQTLESVGVQ